MSPSRAAWVRPGGPRVPDGAKAKRYGIEYLVYDATDPAISAAFFDEVRSWGFKPGITRDPGWNNLDGIHLARVLNEDLIRLDSSDKTCLVVADIEAMWFRGAGYVIEFLKEWRRLRPTRITVWTTEPLQGGTVSDELAAVINADKNLYVAPQLYLFDMTPLPEGAVLLEMGQNPERRNVARQRICAYYDARHVPPAWSGLLFDFGLAA